MRTTKHQVPIGYKIACPFIAFAPVIGITLWVKFIAPIVF